MTLAPPRPRTGRFVEPRPLRHPDAGSPAFMGRRARWLVALNVLIPGSAQILAGNRRLGRLGIAATLLAWTLVIAAAACALFWRSALVAALSNWFVLTGIQVLLVAYAVLWIVLTIDTLRLARLGRAGTGHRLLLPIAALAVLALLSGGAAQAATAVGTGKGALDLVFGNSGPSLPPSDGYYNILLLGADSSESRDSMRFDSISVVSVNAETGAMTITGIPRDLQSFPFSPGPMKTLYPDRHSAHNDRTCGWGSGINQLRTEVEVCRDGGALYPGAEARGSSPGIEATKDAAEGILGIEIPYYVLIDMKGFAALVDALGGVEITVTDRLPKGGGPKYKGQPAKDWATGWIEPGTQRMNGTTALWYARSRYTTDDWDRMKRQRELQAAILEQFTPQTVLLRFNEVVDAGAAVVRTDLPREKLPEFFDLAMLARQNPVTRIELTPDGGVKQEKPDIAYIHELIRVALHPPVPEKESTR